MLGPSGVRLSFILYGTLFGILRRLGTYRMVVSIFYNTTVPAKFLFLQNIFLLLVFLSVDANSMIKRSIVRVFHHRTSACHVKIVAILEREIPPIVIHPFAPTIQCQLDGHIISPNAAESSPHIGGVSAGVNGGDGTNESPHTSIVSLITHPFAKKLHSLTQPLP